MNFKGKGSQTKVLTCAEAVKTTVCKVVQKYEKIKEKTRVNYQISTTYPKSDRGYLNFNILFLSFLEKQLHTYGFSKLKYSIFIILINM